MQGALTGIRVLELARALEGLFAGHVLADLGADVLKVEQPGSGDESRRYTPPTYADESCCFRAVNRNRSASPAATAAIPLPEISSVAVSVACGVRAGKRFVHVAMCS